MMELGNLSRWFGARKGVPGVDKGVNGANKGVLTPSFALNVTIYCVQGRCEKRCHQCG